MQDIPLDDIKLPDWLVQYNSWMDLAREAARLAHEARQAVAARPNQFAQPFDTAVIAAWAARVRAESLPAEALAQIEASLTVIVSAEAKLDAEKQRQEQARQALSPGWNLPSEEAHQASWEIVRALENAANTIEVAAGKAVRDRDSSLSRSHWSVLCTDKALLRSSNFKAARSSASTRADSDDSSRP